MATPGGARFAFAAGGGYRATQLQGRVHYDPRRGVFTLWVDGIEIKPLAAPRQTRHSLSVSGTPASATASLRPPPGVPSHAVTTNAAARLAGAYRSMMVIAFVNGLLGLVMLSPVVSTIPGIAMGGVGAVVIGVLYGILAFLVSRRSRLALAMGLALFTLDGLATLILAGITPGVVVGAVLRVTLIVLMARGFGAIAELDEEDGSHAPAVFGLGGVLVALVGVIALLHFAVRRGMDEVRHGEGANAGIQAETEECLRKADAVADEASARLEDNPDPFARMKAEQQIANQRRVARMGCSERDRECKRDHLSLPCVLGVK